MSQAISKSAGVTHLGVPAEDLRRTRGGTNAWVPYRRQLIAQGVSAPTFLDDMDADDGSRCLCHVPHQPSFGFMRRIRNRVASTLIVRRLAIKGDVPAHIADLQAEQVRSVRGYGSPPIPRPWLCEFDEPSQRRLANRRSSGGRAPPTVNRCGPPAGRDGSGRHRCRGAGQRQSYDLEC